MAAMTMRRDPRMTWIMCGPPVAGFAVGTNDGLTAGIFRRRTSGVRASPIRPPSAQTVLVAVAQLSTAALALVVRHRAVGVGQWRRSRPVRRMERPSWARSSAEYLTVT